MMSTEQEKFWIQFSKENDMVLFAADWNRFCKAKKTDEETLKKLLFRGKLSDKEFQSIVFCIIITVPFEQPILYYPVLFKQCPQLMERCNWDMLNKLDWLILLGEYPQFIDKCDILDEFDGEDWSCLLCKQPQFSDKCDKWASFGSDAWFELLYTQPQFSDKCNKWDEFEGEDWANLLSAQAQFADKCDKWNEFDVFDWKILLKAQPQFAAKCNKWDEFNEDEKEALIAKHPDLTKYFPLEKKNEK